MQQLLISTFSSVTHRPSAEKVWQQPAMEEEVLPMKPCRNPRRLPLEVQAASYLAASVRISSLLRTSMAYRAALRRGCRAGRSI